MFGVSFLNGREQVAMVSVQFFEGNGLAECMIETFMMRFELEPLGAVHLRLH